MYEIQHLIDGQAAESTSENSGPVFDPATGEQIAQVGLASVAEVDAAVASARSASTEWGEVSLARRTKLMLEFRNLVVDNAEEVAKRLTAEHGKVDTVMSKGRILISGDAYHGEKGHGVYLRRGLSTYLQ